MADFGRLGGRVKSRRKAAALRALHASRRGKRVHPDTRGRETILADLHQQVTPPQPEIASIRVVARYCRVDARTVRRWMSGEDWPAETHLSRLAQWLRRSAA